MAVELVLAKNAEGDYHICPRGGRAHELSADCCCGPLPVVCYANEGRYIAVWAHLPQEGLTALTWRASNP